jgi:ribosomal protein S12 methylthiotransferase accessory factor
MWRPTDEVRLGRHQRELPHGTVVMKAHASKGYKTGTHRLVSPAETLARVQPLLPKMGITRLANVTGLDTI